MQDVSQIGTDLRYERKYRIEQLDLGAVLQVIRNHPASFKVLYPDRQINNVYYDQPDFKGYKHNLMGIGLRRKYRLRWYGPDLADIQKAQMEVKQRENELGSKIVKPVSGLGWEETIRLFDRDYPHDAPLRPALINTYLRSYFGAINGRFRITVDRNQAFLPLADRVLPNKQWLDKTSLPYSDEAYILELKYDAEFDQAAQQIMYYLPFRQSRNSKYVNGLANLEL